MNKIIGASLVLLGVGVGCGAATVATKTWPGTAEAETNGGWFCAVVNRFPDVEWARDSPSSKTTEAGLNKMASHVPRGQILTVGTGSVNGSPSDVICVKQ